MGQEVCYLVPGSADRDVITIELVYDVFRLTGFREPMMYPFLHKVQSVGAGAVAYQI